LSATLVRWDATTWSRQVLYMAEPRDKSLCLLCLSFIVSIVLHKSSPLYSLDFIVLTLNQVCGVKFYRITYSPPSRCSHSKDSLVRSFSYFRDFISGYRLRWVSLPSFMILPNISVSVPPLPSFSLRRFFPWHGWLVVEDGR
jgi:hypothetical protein